MATIEMEKIPKLKFYAETNASFRIFVPVTVAGIAPADLAAYTWKAHLRDSRNTASAKLMEFTCVSAATGVWINGSEVDMTSLLVSGLTRTCYGNLLFEQPGFAGVHLPAAEIEMVVNFGETVWS